MRAIVTVIGKDQIGIIAKVCNLLARHNANVLDISQTILQDYFTMIMLVELSELNVPFASLAAIMEVEGEEIGLSIRIQREEIFNAMHRI